jgi:alkanesulfonate monooxygenase SsuD/methylene tetrahydromethanopterin reductase-like flavin-dependent oxidoreductase (luciferase family)
LGADDASDGELRWFESHSLRDANMKKRLLQVGVQLPEVERVVGWPEYREMATTAEAVGFDSLWVGDHLLYRDDDGTTGPLEAWSVLAALAAATESVKIGPLVASTSFHNPAMLAKKAATVDEISGGRLILGLGAGWNRIEYDAYGFPYDHRVSRFEEAFTIIRTLLADGAIDFEGTYYSARDCVLEPKVRPEGIPLMIGSEGPRMLAATLPYVSHWNGWHAWRGNTPQGARELVENVDAACLEAGVAPDSVERTMAVLVRAPGGEDRLIGSPGRSMSRTIGGTQEQIAESLAEFAAVGVSHVQLVVDPITVEAIEWLGGVLEALDSSD